MIKLRRISRHIDLSEQSKYQNRAEYVQSYVNNGYSLAASNTACDEYFPPGPAQKAAPKAGLGTA
jgi:hypothetical protein